MIRSSKICTHANNSRWSHPNSSRGPDDARQLASATGEEASDQVKAFWTLIWVCVVEAVNRTNCYTMNDPRTSRTGNWQNDVVRNIHKGRIQKARGKPVKPTRTMESSLSRLTASTRLPWLALCRVGSCPACVMVYSFGSWQALKT